MNSSFSFHINLAILALFLFVSAEANIVNDEPLDNEPKIVENSFRFPSLVDDYIAYLGHHASYIELSNSTQGHARMFYYFFESKVNDSNAPVIMWLTGGPGCSSTIGLFHVNGPFKITQNLSLVPNEHSWDKVANILYIDQPIGTGFSYSSNHNDIPIISEQASVHFYEFIQAFFRKHPQLSRNDVYIIGESYAGHYIPVFASTIYQANKNGQGPHINLKGIAIGNGMTNSIAMYSSYPDYAILHNLINQTKHNKLEGLVKKCLDKTERVCDHGSSYDREGCTQALRVCLAIKNAVTNENPHLDAYDIRKNLTHDILGIEYFLNQPNVKRALGVGQRQFKLCSEAVQEIMLGDVMRNMAVYIPELLDNGIKLLLYDGEYDFTCNWLGNWKWVHEMRWSGQRRFNASSEVPFTVNQTQAGLQKSHGNLIYLKVHNAGHMVPRDQPKAAIHMLKRWLRGRRPL